MVGGEWAVLEEAARLQLSSPVAVVASAGVSINKAMVVWKWAKAWPPVSNPGLRLWCRVVEWMMVDLGCPPP